MDIVICILCFGFVVLMVKVFINIATKKDLYQDRLQSIRETSERQEPSSKMVRVSFKTMFQKISGLFAARSFTDGIQAQLISAGIPLRGEEYITICLILIILLPLIVYVLTANLWLAIIFLLIGVFVPKLYVNHKKDIRLQTLNQQLADALIVMANALRAGFGFQQAMDTVRKELPPPISSEFAWTLREMNLGVSHEEALVNLSNRVKSEDLDMVVTGIIIQRQVGGNLAQILENIASTMRERARIKREIKILTAQGRLSGFIIGLLPVVLIAAMLIINPEYFNVMITDARGMVILGAAVFFEILGVLIIKKITNIDY